MFYLFEHLHMKQNDAHNIKNNYKIFEIIENMTGFSIVRVTNFDEINLMKLDVDRVDSKVTIVFL